MKTPQDLSGLIIYSDHSVTFSPIGIDDHGVIIDTDRSDEILRILPQQGGPHGLIFDSSVYIRIGIRQIFRCAVWRDIERNLRTCTDVAICLTIIKPFVNRDSVINLIFTFDVKVHLVFGIPSYIKICSTILSQIYDILKKFTRPIRKNTHIRCAFRSFFR